MRGIILFAMLLAALACTSPTYAQDEADESSEEPETEDDADLWGHPQIGMSASVGAYWALPTVTDKHDVRHDNNNKVDGFLRGASLSVSADLAKSLDARIAFAAAPRSEWDIDQDGANDDPDAGKLVAAIGAAYATWYAAPYFRVQGGLIPLSWSGIANNAWGYTFAASAASRRFGISSSYDLGAKVSGDLPYGAGAYSLAVVNGEGSKKPEENRYKAGHATLAVHPLPFGALRGIGLAGCAVEELRDDPPGAAVDRRRAYAGLLVIPFYFFRLGAEGGVNLRYESVNKGPLRDVFLSGYLTADPWYNLGFFVRADARDPDMDNRSGKESPFDSRIEGRSLSSDEDARMDLFAGTSYVIRRRVGAGAFGYARFYEERDNGASLPPTITANLVLTVGF